MKRFSILALALSLSGYDYDANSSIATGMLESVRGIEPRTAYEGVIKQRALRLLDLAQQAEGRPLRYGIVPRLEFYAEASRAYAVVHTLDAVPYGCFILHKGVIFDEA